MMSVACSSTRMPHRFDLRRVTLVWPYLERLATTPEDDICLQGMVSFPLGIGYLAACLRSDYEVSLLDLCARSLSPKAMPGHRVRLGCTDDEIRALLLERRPDVVGISQMFSYLDRAITSLVRLVREICPDARIVLGGIHPTVCPEAVLSANPEVDFVVLGEGEVAFRNLLDCLNHEGDVSRLRSLAYRDRTGIVVNTDRDPLPDVDALPLPARDMVDMRLYQNPANLVTSRGCPYRCSFCAAERLHHGRWRGRRPDLVVEELRNLVTTYGTTSVWFQDENMGVDQARMGTLFDSIGQAQLPLRWSCQTAFTVSRLTRDLLERAKRAGATEIGLALESGNDHTLAIVGKPSRTEHIRRVRRWAGELGLYTSASLVVGLPGETREDVHDTQRFALALELDSYTVVTLLPLPGTRLQDELTAAGQVVDPDLISNFRYAHYSVSPMSPGDINALREETDYLLNFKQCAALRGTAYQTAITRFSNLTRKYPRLAKCHYYLGLAFYKAGEPGAALTSFETAVGLEADFEQVSAWCSALRSLPRGSRYLDPTVEAALGFWYYPYLERPETIHASHEQ